MTGAMTHRAEGLELQKTGSGMKRTATPASTERTVLKVSHCIHMLAQHCASFSDDCALSLLLFVLVHPA